MAIRAVFADLEDLWDGVCHRLWHDEPQCHDGYRGKSALSLDNILKVKSISNPVDPVRVNYTVTKFRSVCRNYVNIEGLDYMLDNSERYLKARGDIATEVHCTFNEVGGHLHPRGNCLLALSLAWMKHGKPRICIYSRASECTNTMAIDGCLFRALACYIGERLNFDPSDCTLTWFIGTITFNAQMAPPWVWQSGHWDECNDTSHEERTWLQRRVYQGVNKALTTPDETIAMWPFRREARYAMWSKAYERGEFLHKPTDMAGLTLDCLNRGGTP